MREGGEDGGGEVVKPLIDEAREESFGEVEGCFGWEGDWGLVDGEDDGEGRGFEVVDGGEVVCYGGEGSSDIGDGGARNSERCGDGVEFVEEVEAILGDVFGEVGF